MTLRFLALIAALLLAACGSSERDWPSPSPALWEVTAPDGKKGWLFGTVHALPDGVAWRTPTFDGAWAQSGLLLVEIANLSDASDAADALARRARTPGLPPLSRRVAARDRPALRAFLDKADLADSDFEGTETWAAALALASATRTADPREGVDRALLAADKPRMGLESFDAQFAMFDRLAEADQADLLMGVVRDAETAGDDGYLIAWLTGDLMRLQADSSRGILAYPRLADVLVQRRNRNWLPEIERSMAAGQKPFVAVGAGHMLGSDGLPALLRAEGYAVRRLQ